MRSPPPPAYGDGDVSTATFIQDNNFALLSSTTDHFGFGFGFGLLTMPLILVLLFCIPCMLNSFIIILPTVVNELIVGGIKGLHES